MTRPKINGEAIEARVHALVTEAFYGKRPKELVVNHKDGDKHNNAIENLEYVTVTENNIHAIATGLRGPHGFTKKKQKCCSSDFIGVTWRPNERQWRSQIKFQGTKHYLGQYESEYEAARVYVKARTLCELSLVAGGLSAVPSPRRAPTASSPPAPRLATPLG